MRHPLTRLNRDTAREKAVHHQPSHRRILQILAVSSALCSPLAAYAPSQAAYGYSGNNYAYGRYYAYDRGGAAGANEPLPLPSYASSPPDSILPPTPDFGAAKIRTAEGAEPATGLSANPPYGAYAPARSDTAFVPPPPPRLPAVAPAIPQQEEQKRQPLQIASLTAEHPRDTEEPYDWAAERIEPVAAVPAEPVVILKLPEDRPPAHSPATTRQNAEASPKGQGISAIVGSVFPEGFRRLGSRPQQDSAPPEPQKLMALEILAVEMAAATPQTPPTIQRIPIPAEKPVLTASLEPDAALSSDSAIVDSPDTPAPELKPTPEIVPPVEESAFFSLLPATAARREPDPEPEQGTQLQPEPVAPPVTKEILPERIEAPLVEDTPPEKDFLQEKAFQQEKAAIATADENSGIFLRPEPLPPQENALPAEVEPVDATEEEYDVSLLTVEETSLSLLQTESGLEVDGILAEVRREEAQAALSPTAAPEPESLPLIVEASAAHAAEAIEHAADNGIAEAKPPVAAPVEAEPGTIQLAALEETALPTALEPHPIMTESPPSTATGEELAPLVETPAVPAAYETTDFPVADTPIEAETIPQALPPLEIEAPSHPLTALPEVVTPVPPAATPEAPIPYQESPVHYPEAQAIAQPEAELSETSRHILRGTPSAIGSRETLAKSPQPVIIKRESPSASKLPAVDVRSHEELGLKIEIRKANPNLNSYLEQAYENLMAGRYQIAAGFYQETLKIDPKNELALFGLATTYQKLGNPDEAREHYARLLAANPTHREALNNFMALISQEAPQAAIAELERLEEQSPDFSPVSAQLGIVYTKTGDYRRAVNKLLRAVYLSPENLSYKYNLAIALDKLGERQQAAELYLELIEHYKAGANIPGNIETIRNRVIFLNQTR